LGDLAFPLVGERVARDHGYALYGALCRVAPGLHAAAWLGVHPLGGKPGDAEPLPSGSLATDASRTLDASRSLMTRLRSDACSPTRFLRYRVRSRSSSSATSGT